MEIWNCTPEQEMTADTGWDYDTTDRIVSLNQWCTGRFLTTSFGVTEAVVGSAC